MRSLFTSLVVLAVLLFACEQPEDRDAPTALKTSREPTSTPVVPSERSTPRPMSLGDTMRDNETLADHICELPDESMPDLIEAVASESDPKLRRTLLTTVYEETSLRPPTMRLPLLLEIARAEDVSADLRVTIMGELGTTLQTDHGTSWADWSLAIEEYLAEKHGLIRVE